MTIDEAVVQECMIAFPDSVSEIEAVDKACQKEYSILINMETSEEGYDVRVVRFLYLKQLRISLINKRIRELKKMTGKN